MNRIKRIIVPGMVGLGALAGVVGGSALTNVAVHADATSSTTTSTSTQNTGSNTQQPKVDPTTGAHIGDNGITEVALTGDVLTKAKAAAQAYISGGTVVRAETDAEGAKYEVHMTKSDGTFITVKLDENFKVTGTTDEGGGPRAGSDRQKGNGVNSSSSSSSSN